MREMIWRKFSATKIISYGLFAFSLIVLVSTFYLISSVHVIENWKLEIPQGKIHAGDQLVLLSTYTKLRDVDGTALRYIECKTAANVFVRYPISEAKANRQQGTAGTGIPIVVPRDIPNLPATCKFSISITYDVLPFKKDTPKNSTREFVLYPAQEPPKPGAGPM